MIYLFRYKINYNKLCIQTKDPYVGMLKNIIKLTIINKTQKSLIFKL